MAYRSENHGEVKEHTSFWATLPGILTALAGLITAIGGTYAVIESTKSDPRNGTTYSPKPNPNPEVPRAVPDSKKNPNDQDQDQEKRQQKRKSEITNMVSSSTPPMNDAKETKQSVPQETGENVAKPPAKLQMPPK